MCQTPTPDRDQGQRGRDGERRPGTQAYGAALIARPAQGRSDALRDVWRRLIIKVAVLDRCPNRLKTREVAPTIVSLQDQFEAWRKGEIERQRAKLGPLTPQQEEAIDAITRGLVNKIAHGPISELRRTAADPTGQHLMGVIRKLFRLGSE